MRNFTQLVVLALTIPFCLPLSVHAQDLGGRPIISPEQINGADGAALTDVDHHLLAALLAEDEAGRESELRAAQVVLDNLSISQDTLTDIDSTSNEMDWLVKTDQNLERFQAQTRKDLREGLMQKLWVSPYGTITADDLSTLEVISDALSLLREISRVGGGDIAALEQIHSRYWSDLENYQRVIGIDYAAVGDTDSALVFEQQVLQGPDGDIHLYQLTRTEDEILRWVQLPRSGVPADLLTSEALTVDLSRESAPWLIVLEGEGLVEKLQDHKNWLLSIEEKVRLVLLERGNYSEALQNMPQDWYDVDRNTPYILRANAKDDSGQLHLIHVSKNRVLGSWPIGNLNGQGSLALKTFISRILSAPTSR